LEVGEEEKPENCVVRVRKAVLRFLDAGSDSISISYRKKGIGSRASVIITLVAVVGLLAFLIIFGIMKSDTVVEKYDENDPEQTVTIPANELHFAIPPGATFSAYILDGNFNIVEDVVPFLAWGTTCEQQLTASEVTKLHSWSSNISCIPTDLDLVRSLDLTAARYLYINPIAQTIFMLTSQKQISDLYQPLNRLIAYKDVYSYTKTYYEVPLTLVEIEDSDSQQTTYQLRSAIPKPNLFNNLTGYLFGPALSKSTIQSSTADFFDAVQNVWTFTVICFTVIVLKLTKYVNLREKQTCRSAEKTEFRDSICIFLAKLDGLLHGRHRP
jgi:hypothetical protein